MNRSKKKPVRPQIGDQMRDTPALWPVAGAFDWSGDGADEPVDGAGLGEQVGDTMSAERVLPAPCVDSVSWRDVG